MLNASHRLTPPAITDSPKRSKDNPVHTEHENHLLFFCTCSIPWASSSHLLKMIKGLRLRWLPVSLFPAKSAPRTCYAMPCQTSSAPTSLFPSELTQANHHQLFPTLTLEWFHPLLNQAMSDANSFLTLFSSPNSPLTVTSKVTVACVLRSGSGPSVTSY